MVVSGGGGGVVGGGGAQDAALCRVRSWFLWINTLNDP